MHFFHFFVPHHKNNHRAALLHNATLFLLIVTVGLTSSLGVFLYRSHPEVLGISYQITNTELLNLTNYERAQNGLPPLALDSQLTDAASKKADHMYRFDYWAHFAPDGTSPWDFIRSSGYSYSYAGENLAKGFTTSVDAVAAWMRSPTHKANILSSKYKDVGFTIKEGKLQGEDTVLIVQEFGSRDDTFIKGDQSQNLDVEGASLLQVQGSQIPVQDVSSKPAIDISVVAKTVTFILLSALLIALILDFVIIEKKKIPRLVGNNLDHIILITIFIAFLVMARLGKII